MSDYILSRRDYEIYYRNTYVSHTEDDEYNAPFLIQSIESENEDDEEDGGNDDCIFRGRLLEKNENNGYDWNQTSFYPEDLTLDFPQIGYINSPSGMSFLIHRKAVQQYRRGIYAEVIEIVDPFDEEREYLKLPKPSSLNNKSILINIFNNNFFTIEEALDLVKKGERLSAAINDKWCIASKYKVGKIALLKDKNPIGFFNDEGVVELSLKFLKEEIEAQGFEVKEIEN